MSQESGPKGRLHLVLATHERKVLDLACDEVTLPGRLGEFGVLPGHMPLLSILNVGELRYRDGKKTESFAVSGGFAEIADDMVTVLAESAHTPSQIDVPAAQSESKEALAELSVGGLDEVKAARSKLEAAAVRLQVAGRSSQG
ncbi:MAG: ATP synthase F1 subunit epsilon [Thermoanaerobaculia bacterium]|nr:ATP synthase F1 subunit epsilon [Thermoanaerobaculia bacterium]